VELGVDEERFRNISLGIVTKTDFIKLGQHLQIPGEFMKRHFFISFTTIVLFFSTTVFSKIWTVDNKSGSVADFSEIQVAHNNASDGDTIYVHSSGSSIYASVTVTKQLYIIGPGYFLDENPNTQADTRAAICKRFIFNDGSQGSLLTGFEINIDISYWDDILINADNIIIKRNMCVHDGANISITEDRSNIIITGNYFISTGTVRDVIQVGLNCNNIQINNNYFKIAGTTNFSLVAPSSSSIEAWNNVISGNVEISNSTFYNNILMNGTFSGTNSPADINHNIGDADQFGIEYGNQENVNMTTVFIDNGSGSTDGDWQLRSGSPAIAAGLSGEDCGMFGSSTPYILSGLPAIPTIYFFVAPSSASGTEGLEVQIKAKSNN